MVSQLSGVPIIIIRCLRQVECATIHPTFTYFEVVAHHQMTTTSHRVSLVTYPYVLHSTICTVSFNPSCQKRVDILSVLRGRTSHIRYIGVIGLGTP